MNDYEIKLDVDPKEKYQKARKALAEADLAISALTPQEQRRLAEDYFTPKGLRSLFDFLQHYGNR